MWRKDRTCPNPKFFLLLTRDVEDPPSRSIKKRAHKKSRTGAVDKNSDMVVVDHSGAWLAAKDGGRVKINLAKFILAKVTKEEIEDCAARRVVDYDKNAIGTDQVSNMDRLALRFADAYH
jgi:hypothetical protein